VLVCSFTPGPHDLPGAPALLATRMDASTIEIDAGHLSLITHPHEIGNLILDAARVTSEAADRQDHPIPGLSSEE
jgi:hypothetical protein